MGLELRLVNTHVPSVQIFRDFRLRQSVLTGKRNHSKPEPSTKKKNTIEDVHQLQKYQNHLTKVVASKQNLNREERRERCHVTKQTRDL